MSPQAPVPESAPGQPDDLTLRVRLLEQRVLQLEARIGIAPAAAAQAIPPESIPPLAAPGPLDLPSNVVPVLGRTLVAVAGAYVLRALTEGGVMPPAAGVATGLLYALVWLWIAARSRATGEFAAALSCSTSVVIMAPLVWEATGRLKVLSPQAGAAILAGFALLALALAWGTPHRIVATIAGVSSIAMALALAFARNEIVPFTVALLVIAAAMEFSAWRGQAAGARGFAALAANVIVLVFSDLMSGPHGMPDTWAPAAPGALLAAQMSLAGIYIATAITQTVLRRVTLSLPEIAQITAALLIGIGGAAWVFSRNGTLMLALGLAALAGGMACYAVSFLLFEQDNKWNFRAWAGFGLVLVLAGTYLPFASSGVRVLACACALACCWMAKRYRLPTLRLHGAVYLALGSAAAGGTGLTAAMLFGTRTRDLPWLASGAVLLVAAVCWWTFAGSAAAEQHNLRDQISSLITAAHFVWLAAGLTAYGALAVWPSAPADTLGTVILTAAVLALAWAGTRWSRRELVWLLYGVLAAGAYKLVSRDFMNEHTIALVVSLACYGGTLILLPRMLRERSADLPPARSQDSTA